MFALVISSRPVITQFATISPTQFSFSVPSVPSFSHLAIFLLPGQVLPEGTAAAVYIRLTPDSDFKLLGAIANEKQSAIFKIKESALSAANTPATTDDLMIDDDLSAAQPTGAEIIIGISIEPAATVQAQLAALKAQRVPQSNALVLVKPQERQNSGSGVIPTKLLAQRIIGNAFNFLSSYGDTVPLKSFESWWHKFEKKIELDPTFLEREA